MGVGVWRPQVKGEHRAFCEWAPSPLLTPPPPIQACRVLLWRGDGNPGTWQQAGDLLAPHSSCFSFPSLSLSWPSSFIFSSCSLSPCLSPSLAWPCFVHLFYFKALSLSLKFVRKEILLLQLSGWNTEGWKEERNKKGEERRGRIWLWNREGKQQRERGK